MNDDNSNPETACAIGVDVGGTKIAAGIVDPQDYVLEKQLVPTLPNRGGEAVLQDALGLAGALRDETCRQVADRNAAPAEVPSACPARAGFVPRVGGDRQSCARGFCPLNSSVVLGRRIPSTRLMSAYRLTARTDILRHYSPGQSLRSGQLLFTPNFCGLLQQRVQHFAVPRRRHVPNGFGDEETIRAIWASDASSPGRRND